MRIIDISRAITADMPVWPGDPGVSIRQVSYLDNQGCNVSELYAGLHTGTHIDAPWHFIKDGKRTDQLDLSYFYGPCKVFEIMTSGDLVKSDMESLDIEEGDIVLLKTRNSRKEKSNDFDTNFCALSVDASMFLVQKKIKTIGIDYLSVESYQGSGDVHRNLLQNNIGVIEGLDLAGVKPGHYVLSALPLKIFNAEGSPIRAVLIEA